MKRLMSVMVVAIVIVVSGGCIETKPYMRERVDQAMAGNRGYLRNVPIPVTESTESKTRSMIEVGIELPPYLGWERYHWTDNELWGNKGYIYSVPSERKKKEEEKKSVGPLAPASKEERPKKENKATVPEARKAEEGTEKESLPLTYTVKKNETLQDIAARPEIYSDYSKWSEIYEANKNGIKDPNKIYPGQVLVIPRE